jgi:hypothetical protein
MAEQGGYRQPANPAPVSGPGALSERTDGGAVEGMTPPQAKQDWTGLPYGDNKAVNDQQSGADLAGNPVPQMPSPVVPLNAPTQRPDEPVTTGIPLGPGAGTESRPLPNQAPTLIDTIRHLTQYDPSGDAELVYRQMLDNQTSDNR